GRDRGGGGAPVGRLPGVKRASASGLEAAVVSVLTLALAVQLLHLAAVAWRLSVDSGYYHIPIMRWAADFPAVPGVVNLFPFLAYNQSFLLYATVVNVGPLAQEGHHVANGILVLVLLARCALGLARAVKADGPGATVDLYYALLLPAAFGLAFDINLTSPSPDLAFVPWLAHGAVLSGYPLYPSPLMPLPVEWRAPLAATIAQANAIREWNGVAGAWRVALSDPRWFAGLLGTLGWTQRDVVLALAIAAVELPVAAGRWVFGRRVPLLGVALVPTVAGLVFAFVAAPQARFAGALPWVLA